MTIGEVYHIQEVTTSTVALPATHPLGNVAQDFVELSGDSRLEACLE